MKNLRKLSGRILAMILLIAVALTGSVIAALAEAALAEAAPEAAFVELKTGDRGDNVAMVQNALIAWNSEALPLYGVDGIYGAETAAAISTFQAAKELDATGICDTVTWELLLKNAEDMGVTVTAERSPAKRTVPAEKKRSGSGNQSSSGGKAAATKPAVPSVDAPTKAPTATKQPAQPEITQQPENTRQPEATQPPVVDVTREPEATATPHVAPTKAPEVTATPHVAPTKTPEATATPHVAPTKTPEATKKPSATEKPEVTKEPEATPSATPEVKPSAVPVCEHNWVENTTTHEVEEKGHYETVHHDAVTEEQQVLVKEGWTESYTIYACPECGAQYNNMLGFSLHQSSAGHGGLRIIVGGIDHPAEYETQTVVVQEAYDEEVWVVDEPAYTEEIPNGTYTCSKCGATK